MKKKILGVLLLLVFAVALTACGKKVTLNDVIEKFNNCDTVKSFKEYGYDMVAEATKDSLKVTSTMGEDSNSVEFKFDGKVLSNEKVEYNQLIIALLVIDGVGQAHGYADGELIENLNAFPNEIQEYTLAKEGIDIKINEDYISLKIDITKKTPLIDMNKFYLTTDDFDSIKEIIDNKSNGNQSGKSGNIAYDVFVGDKESTIKIGQDGKLGDSAYKSILSALEVMYGKDVADQFKELYPKFVDEKTTLEAFTIETHYDFEDKDDSMFKDTDVVLVTIKNKKVK